MIEPCSPYSGDPCSSWMLRVAVTSAGMCFFRCHCFFFFFLAILATTPQFVSSRTAQLPKSTPIGAEILKILTPIEPQNRVKNSVGSMRLFMGPGEMPHKVRIRTKSYIPQRSRLTTGFWRAASCPSPGFSLGIFPLSTACD